MKKKIKFFEINSILNNTKSLSRSNSQFIDYMIRKNNSFYENQLPYVLSTESSYKTITNKSFNENLDDKEKEEKKSIIKSYKFIKKQDFKNIRIYKKNNLPPVCPNLSKDIKIKLNFEKKLNIFKNIKKIILKKNQNFLGKNLNSNELNNNNNNDNIFYFNQNEIFNLYTEILTKFFLKLKKEKNLNLTNFIQKNFIYNEIKYCFKLKSLSIKFEHNNKIIKEFVLPFNLLPIFYIKTLQTFKFFLLKIIKFKDDEIIFNENEIYPLLNCNIYGDNLFNFDKIYLNHGKNYFYHDIYKFYWFCKEKIYTIIITTPILFIERFNKKTNKIESKIKYFLEKELTFYLMSKNFIKWNYYLIAYFLTFKHFQNNFFHNKQNTLILNDINNEIEDDNYDIKNINENEYEIYQELKIKIITDRDFYLNNIFYNNNNDYLNKENFIFSFHPFFYNVSIINNDNNNVIKTKNIYFNIGQYKKFIEITEYMSSIQFFLKFIGINFSNFEIKFNYEFLDQFNIKEFLNEMNKYDDDYKKKKFFYSKNYFEYLYKNIKIRIEYKNALLSVYNVINRNIIEKKFNIKESFYKENYIKDNIIFLKNCLKEINKENFIMKNENKIGRISSKKKFSFRKKSQTLDIFKIKSIFN